jgi:hypothetical protein
MVKILAVLGAAAAGAALMYIFDPEEGGRRRALMRDKATGLSNDAKEAIGSKSRDLRNRAQGFVHEAKSMLPSGENREQAFDAGEKVFE